MRDSSKTDVPGREELGKPGDARRMIVVSICASRILRARNPADRAECEINDSIKDAQWARKSTACLVGRLELECS
jgi:hypothetical protein